MARRIKTTDMTTLDADAAEIWLRRVGLHMMPATETPDHPEIVALMTARAEFGRLHTRLAEAGVDPVLIVQEARALLAARGHLERVDGLASSPPGPSSQSS